MQLEHSFSVPVGIDEAWKILLDIEQIGPCMPGAAIDSVDGDDFTGTVKVKLGPINLTYKGKASFIEKDAAAHRAVIDARGRDARGNGTAAAKVTATLVEAGSSTEVKVNTDLDITGKPAQFGRGVMVDVGNKLIGQFADALADLLGSGALDPSAATPADAPAKAAAEAPAAAAAAPAEPKRASRPKPARPAAGASAAKSDEPAAESATGSTAAETTAAEAPAAESPATTSAAESTPAFAVPGGGVPTAEPDAVSSVNGHASESGAQPRREVEPINLLESAGPAVAKRLAPVAVALVVVLVAARRRRSRRA